MSRLYLLSTAIGCLAAGLVIISASAMPLCAQEKGMEKQKQEEGKSEPEPGELKLGEKKAGENNNK
jgi:hypothetical protein